MASIASLATMLELAVVDKLIRGDIPLEGTPKPGPGFIALSSFLVCLGLGFFIYAAHLWMQPRYSPEMAALLTAALSLWLAVMVLAVAYIGMGYRRKRLKMLGNSIVKNIQDAFEAVDADLRDPVGEHPRTALLLASLAGFVVGEKIT